MQKREQPGRQLVGEQAEPPQRVDVPAQTLPEVSIPDAVIAWQHAQDREDPAEVQRETQERLRRLIEELPASADRLDGSNAGS